MRWQGLVCAVPLSAGAIASLELGRLPDRAHGGDPARLAGALSHLVSSAFEQLGLPALLLLAAAAALFGLDRVRDRAGAGRLPSVARAALAARAPLAALAALGLAQAAFAREVLIEHHPFSWNPVANAGFVALGIGLAALHVGLGASWVTTRRRLALALGVALAVGSLVVARAHYLVLVGQYPTLHACLLYLCFVHLALGLALSLAVLARPVPTRRAAIALGTLLGALTLLERPADASARAWVIAYTELGRAAAVARALERDRADLLPEALPEPREPGSIAAPDPGGLERFEAHSGLPRLPAGFDLSEHHLLLVLTDATRFDRTSLARPELGTTPHLAALAGRGAHVFERAYAPSNGTFPSLAAMLAMAPVSWTELDLRPRFWRGRLRASRTTAAEALRGAGRSTFWVGHDHEGCFSQNIEGLEQGFDERTLVPQRRGELADADADARIADAAIDAVRRHRRRADAEGTRSFGLVFFVSPHDDYQTHDPSAPAETPRQRYDQELRFMDAQLGRLLAALEADGGMEDTVIVVAGDHGEAFGEHGTHHHLTSVHDEQIRVPLLVWLPGHAGLRHEAPTSTAYALPWLLRRAEPRARAVAERAIRTDLGPWLRALDGAVVSEMIGPRRQEAALIWRDRVVCYDVLADLARIYDPATDPAQRLDLREARPDLLLTLSPLVRRYRRARFEGRRFRFVGPQP